MHIPYHVLLHFVEEGYTQVQIAAFYGINRKTVAARMAEAAIPCFSTIADDELKSIIAEIKKNNGKTWGLRAVCHTLFLEKGFAHYSQCR